MGAECERCGTDIWDECYHCKEKDELKALLIEACDYLKIGRDDLELAGTVDVDIFLNKPEIKKLLTTPTQQSE